MWWSADQQRSSPPSFRYAVQGLGLLRQRQQPHLLQSPTPCLLADRRVRSPCLLLQVSDISGFGDLAAVQQLLVPPGSTVLRKVIACMQVPVFSCNAVTTCTYSASSSPHPAGGAGAAAAPEADDPWARRHPTQKYVHVRVHTEWEAHSDGSCCCKGEGLDHRGLCCRLSLAQPGRNHPDSCAILQAECPYPQLKAPFGIATVELRYDCRVSSSVNFTDVCTISHLAVK